MTFELDPLPYADDALAPFISKETIEYHYGKHHAGYVTKLNAAIQKHPELSGKSLEEVIKSFQSVPGVFNNAAQIWNHTFYWKSLSPSGGQIQSELRDVLTESFGSVDHFQEEFMAKAGGLFGSGWVFLVKDTQQNKLILTQESNAGCPLTKSHQVPLFTCDVWEHAYYIDYRNARPGYLKQFWNHINWDFVAQNLEAS